MKVMKDLVRMAMSRLLPSHIAQLSNDPAMASLPLLTSFLKSFAAPFLGMNPSDPEILLVEKDASDRFKRMCEGYFEKLSRKLVSDYNVCCVHSHWAT